MKRSSRQGLFRTHIGEALIRSAAKQALAVETSTAIKRGRWATIARRGRISPMSLPPPQQHLPSNFQALKERTNNTIATYIQQNPFLKRYANLIDNLSLSSLPPEIDNDIVIHVSDSKNATVEVQSANIKFVIVDGSLCLYPREEIAQKILCGTRGQQRAMFFNSSNNKWTHGCNTSFERVDASISQRAGFREITASTKDLREALRLGDSEKLDITHYFKFLIFHF